MKTKYFDGLFKKKIKEKDFYLNKNMSTSQDEMDYYEMTKKDKRKCFVFYTDKVKDNLLVINYYKIYILKIY